MHKSKFSSDVSQALNTISKEEAEVFKQAIVNPTSLFDNLDKDFAHQINKKYNKFLKYSLILDAKYSASDKLFYNTGVSKKKIKQMQTGNISNYASIDLHGQNLKESCISLANFIHYHQNKDYLHIIHGKGYNANNMSKLKTQVATYLTDHPQIIAFVSCPQNFGGTGAIFAKTKN